MSWTADRKEQTYHEIIIDYGNLFHNPVKLHCNTLVFGNIYELLTEKSFFFGDLHRIQKTVSRRGSKHTSLFSSDGSPGGVLV